MADYYVNSSTGSDSYDGTSPTFTGGTTGPWLTLAHAGGAVAAGATVHVEAIAGNAASWPTSSLDYTIASYFTPTAGTAAGGAVRWVGRNGVPTIGVPGLAFYNTTLQRFVGLYFCATGNTAGSFGVVHGTQMTVKSCSFNLNNQAGLCGIVPSGSGYVCGCTVYGGTTTPAASAGSDGVAPQNYYNVIRGNVIKYCRDRGVYDTAGGTEIAANTIYGCAGNGIECNATGTGGSEIDGNTLDGNGGHGISLTGTGGIVVVSVVNNILSNHTGTGKYGLTLSDGTTALNDSRKRSCDYNCFYNNTSHRNNVSAGDHDLTDVDPTYNDAANGDYTPTNSALQAGLP